MDINQLEECSKVIDWCSKNINSLMRDNFLPDIINICKSNLLPEGARYIPDITTARIVESNFI